ncbi:unknown [Streptomyces phage mu1/6]|uniref:hypothetical protein n=1 Tax=Streptomyces phage mu1/6 TaxID=370623 RepID=UPI0000D4F6C6|nr:hypothetical protein SPMV1_gp24 [Streptomyces phage mu1/6]ABD94189.1 unknown [Streptomyces phage mu1/6]
MDTAPSSPILDTHQFAWDPPGISAVERWTCTHCGHAVLDNRGYVYGGATTTPCAAGGDQ